MWSPHCGSPPSSPSTACLIEQERLLGVPEWFIDVMLMLMVLSWYFVAQLFLKTEKQVCPTRMSTLLSLPQDMPSTMTGESRGHENL